MLCASACYSPDLRDCTVSCAAETDCASGQVCGSDNFCASPDIAGRCASLPTIDGGVATVRDASVPIDGQAVTPDAPTDAPPQTPMTTVRVRVEGQGRIQIDGVGTCDSAGAQDGDCLWDVPAGEELEARAIGYPSWMFDRWTSLSCIVEDSDACEFTPFVPTEVSAKFRRENDD